VTNAVEGALKLGGMFPTSGYRLSIDENVHVINA